MGLTHFPNGVSSFGIPLLGGSGTIPIMGGPGKVYFVDPANGADTNTGLAPDKAFDTIAKAYSMCVSGHGDTIYLLNDGATTGCARETALVWAKNNTHLIGLCAPTMVGQRARIAPPSTDATDVDAYTPYITVSGAGCIFSNFQIYQGNSEDGKSSVGILCSGNRNYFNNVHVANGAHANQGDEATYNLQLTGDENTFENCVFGVDTVNWTGDTGKVPMNIALGSGAADEVQRNVFRNCMCIMASDAATNYFVGLTGATYLTDIQRWNLWDNCTFFNYGTSLTAGVYVPGSSTGYLLFKNCGFAGCDNVTAADNSLVLMQGPIGTAVDVGKMSPTDVA